MSVQDLVNFVNELLLVVGMHRQIVCDKRNRVRGGLSAGDHEQDRLGAYFFVCQRLRELVPFGIAIIAVGTLRRFFFGNIFIVIDHILYEIVSYLENVTTFYKMIKLYK